MANRLPELKAELQRLMAEEIASLQSQAFGVLTEQERRVQSKRLNRIREVSAEWLALLEMGDTGSNPVS
jgi:hypothetical protein